MSKAEKKVGREFNNGWVRLHRLLADEPVFQDEHLWRLYTWLLMHARHTPGSVSLQSGKGKRVLRLNVGQVVVGRNSLGSTLGWSASTAWNRVQRLAELGYISTKVDSQFTVVSIANYQDEQFVEPVKVDRQRTGNGQATDKQRTGNGQATDRQSSGNGQAIDTNREGKKGKQEEKEQKENLREREKSADSADSLAPCSLVDIKSHIDSYLASLLKPIVSPEEEVRYNQIKEQIQDLAVPIFELNAAEYVFYEKEEKRESLKADYEERFRKKFPGWEPEFQWCDTKEELDNIKAHLKDLQAEEGEWERKLPKPDPLMKKAVDSQKESDRLIMARAIYNYLDQQQWKRNGRKVNWRNEVETWVHRDIEKHVKAEKEKASKQNSRPALEVRPERYFQ
jgi:hypothetical protein